MTKKPALKEPIVLSGRVYLAGFLADEVSGFDLPAVLRAGDIKLHNVPKAGKLQRYGQPVEFSGFFAASIWNGKRFCRLLMRKKAAMDATYMGIVELRSKARTCAVDLRRLMALQAVWVAADHGYEVTYNASSHPLSHGATSVASAAEKPALKAAKPEPTVVKSETVTAPAPSSVKDTAVAGVAPLATSAVDVVKASPVVPGEQLALFPDMPVSTGGKKRRRRR
ncbi:hypothetical protein BH11CYA1_BH11CYA1_28260 [soil metagenome]